MKTIFKHGSGGYSGGCRCEICKDAKASYWREHRKVTTAPSSSPQKQGEYRKRYLAKRALVETATEKYNRAEKRREYSARYRAKRSPQQKDRDDQKIKDWAKSNKKNRAEIEARHYRKHKQSLSLKKNLARRVRAALHGENKSASTLTLLGCSVEQLKLHLQNQFTEGMHWNNYGKKGWTIDHIRPCASFDLLDPAEQEKCFHYTNLQPMWFVDNCRKSNKPQEALN